MSLKGPIQSSIACYVSTRNSTRASSVWQTAAAYHAGRRYQNDNTRPCPVSSEVHKEMSVSSTPMPFSTQVDNPAWWPPLRAAVKSPAAPKHQNPTLFRRTNGLGFARPMRRKAPCREAERRFFSWRFGWQLMLTREALLSRLLFGRRDARITRCQWSSRLVRDYLISQDKR